MRKPWGFVCILSVFVLVSGVGAEDKPTPKTELKKLQGVWLVEKAIFGGLERPNNNLNHTITIDYDSGKWISEVNKQNALEEKITFGPTKDPKTIDLVGLNGKRLGIYRLTEDGDLEVCVNQANQPRPAVFTTEKGTEGRGDVYFLLSKKNKK